MNLDLVKEMLRKKIVSYIETEEGAIGSDASIANVMKERDGDRCVTCPRKCVNKEKNMECNNCKRKQHFICAGIRNKDDRKIYIEGNTEFLCSNCITVPITNENSKCFANK